MTEDKLKDGLKDNLIQFAGSFIEAEHETGVNAVWLVSIAAIESGWGTSKLAKSSNNLFGWKADDGYKKFDDVNDCILKVAKSLKKNYLSEDGRFYYGTEIEDVAVCYCPDSDWGNMVRNVYDEIMNTTKA